MKKKTIYEFDLRQYKNNYNDIYLQIENSIKKRVKNNNNGNVGLCLSSGYDSGAISCYLNKINFNYTSYSIKCFENIDILEKRLNLNKKPYYYDVNEKTYLKFKNSYQKSVESTCISQYKQENEIYGYYNLKGDWAGVGLYYIFNQSKKDNIKIFLSGQGADEIFSDYGWKGDSIKNLNSEIKNKNFPFSFCGNFPKDLKTIFPWPNFYRGLNECFIAKEEYTGSLFGIETRYPFLDKNVVQEFLWLNNNLKNKYYKAPLHHYLTKNNYPFCPNQKFGFKVKPKEKLDYSKWLDKQLILLQNKCKKFKKNTIENYTLKKILSTNNFKVCFEFGVFNGHNINIISKHCTKVYGFDSFNKLQDNWVGVCKKKHFKVKGLPKVDKNTTLIRGLFDETLNLFLTKNPNIVIDMIHIDCVLYSSTKDIFNILIKYNKMRKGLIIIFDKLINYNKFYKGGIKALYEINNNNNINFKWLYTHGNVINNNDILQPKYKKMSFTDFRNCGFQQEVAIIIV